MAPAVWAAPTGGGSCACPATGTWCASSTPGGDGMEDCRELTRQERTAIRALVTRWCANYDREHGCLPLDCECFMLGKCWTGAYCRYFREAVLPLDPGAGGGIDRAGPWLCPGARYVGGPSRQTAGGATAPSPAGPRRSGSRNGPICGENGDDAWKIRRLKPLRHKAFKGRFLRGWYDFLSCPCFGQMLSTFSRGALGQSVPKPRLFYLDEEVDHGGQWWLCLQNGGEPAS